MFTGIIDHCGTIQYMDKHSDSMRVRIQSDFKDISLGESIAVDGICLTVTDHQAGLLSFDISKETLRLTTAHSFKEGSLVNLERALQLSSRLGGHMVMGHVDQVCYVHAKHASHEFLEMTFLGLEADSKKFVIKKGSIAVNGVSLTINQVVQQNAEQGFSVMLVPHTLRQTNLATCSLNQSVNVEFDMVVRAIVSQALLYSAR